MSSSTGQPWLVALVAHARDVPSEDRERFARAARPVAGDGSRVLVHTCHRVELYALGAGLAGAAEGVPASIEEAGSRDRPGAGPSTSVDGLRWVPARARLLRDKSAAAHLFEVAAGLDSVVVGEDQILHQLRECLARRHVAEVRGSTEVSREDALDPALERLFQLALKVGREARSWRECPCRSLADVALDTIGVHGRCADRQVPGTPVVGRVLVVGAGRMGRLAATCAARRGVQPVITNRSIERAATLARGSGGEVLPWGSADDLPDVDGIILAVSAQWPLHGRARDALFERSLPVVDISSPPALGGAVRAALGSRYTSVDDLARGPATAGDERYRSRCARLVADAEAEFLQWLRGRENVPTIRRLTERAEARRTSELDHLLGRVPDLDPHVRELVDQMSRRLVAGILHAPVASLSADTTGELDRAARALFEL